MKIIATSEELKDLRNLFIQGFTSLDDKDRNELEDKIKDLENTIDYKNTLIDSLNDDKRIMLRSQAELKEKNQALLKDNINIVTDIELFEKRIKELDQSTQELRKANQAYLSYQFKREKKIKSIQYKTPWALEKEKQDLINSNQILKKAVDNLMEVIDLREQDIKELKTKLEQAEKSSFIQEPTKDIFTMPQDNSIKGLSTGYNPIANKYISAPWINDFKKSGVYGNPLNLELQRECIQLKEKNKELVAEYESLNSNLIEAKKLLEDGLIAITAKEVSNGFLNEKNIKLSNRNEELIGDITKLNKEIENLNLENSKVYHRNKELLVLNAELEKELEIAYSLAGLRLKEINGLINNKAKIIRVLDKYVGDTQPSTKYININVLKDIKQYL